MKELFYLTWNGKTYISTDITEIIAFSLFIGEFGNIWHGGFWHCDICGVVKYNN